MSAVVQGKNQTLQGKCGTSNTSIEANDGFNWNLSQQFWILSSFYYGYVSFQIPGGVLSDYFGGKRMLSFSLVTATLFTLITPLVVNFGIGSIIAFRFILGILQGSIFPATVVLLRNWCTFAESTLFINTAMSGAYFGAFASPILTGYLCEFSLLSGWPLPFYAFGSFGICWCTFWIAVATECPSSSSFVSKNESNHIQINSCRKCSGSLTTPWKKLFTSLPLMATISGSICFNFHLQLILNEYPTFLSLVFGIPISTNGYLSSFPFLFLITGGFIFSYIVDIIKMSYLRNDTARKLVFMFGCITTSLSLLLMIIMDCQLNIIEGLVCASLFFSSAMTQSGPIIADVFPSYAGVAYSILDVFTSACAIASPYVTKVFLIEESDSMQAWSNIFYFDVAQMLTFSIMFFLFVKADPEDWAVSVEDSAEEKHHLVSKCGKN